jgi:FAD/FMN-containing dehydrogenase
MPTADATFLRETVRGQLITPGDAAYDAARKVFNAMIDRRPSLIIRCSGAADVIQGVRFARDHHLQLAIRGGGHSVAGKAVCDAGVMLDLSPMKGIRVDPVWAEAESQAGLTLGDFDAETHAFGFATTLGIVPVTGIAGLTLGGGIGWLNGKFGLACDNLVAADIVLADGRLLTVNAEEHEDLFWAIRGGGGNFGVVTSFRYRLHSVDTVFAGMVVHPLAHAAQVLRGFDEFARTCPDELSLAAGVLTGPDGGGVVALAACWCGPLDQAESAVRPLRMLRPPVADSMQPIAYPAAQRLFDAAFPPGMHHYWKSSFVERLSDPLIDVVVRFMERKPSAGTCVTFQQLHGAAARVPVHATAFPHRRPQFDFGILTQWADAGDTEINLAWTREFHAAVQPFVDQAVYVNNLGDEGEDRVRAAYGENYTRLLAIKKRYDPSNLFRINQNIDPTRE